MATARVKFRASSVDMREGTLYYQIIHNRVARQINTGYKVYVFEWDAEKGQVVLEEAIDQDRMDYLKALANDIKQGLTKLNEIIAKLEQIGKPYSSDDVIAQYMETQRQGGFVTFVNKHITHLQKSGKRSAATKLGLALCSIKKFLEKDDIPFEEVTPDLMEEYEGWLRNRGDCRNTVSFYMRQLRPVYRLAVACGMTNDVSPFKNVYTSIDKTVKRAITKTTFRKIQNLDLSKETHLEKARDLFFFSLYTRGMSFVDMCYLKKTDLRDGVLIYRRQKTKQLMRLKWEKPMQQILDKLGKPDSIYLLPIIEDNGMDENAQRVNALHRLNRNLKKIGKMVGLEISLTSYVARHTWASLMQSDKVPVSTISKGLGHNSEATTKIYLASLDTSAVDKANSKLLSELKP